MTRQTVARMAATVFAMALLAACGGPTGGVQTATATANVTAPTASPTAAPTAAPPDRPTARPTAKPTSPPANTCGAPANRWGYNFCGGGVIDSPPFSFCAYFNCIPSFWESTKGYVEECVDGTYSHSGGRSGSCSSHGGNRRPLYS